MNQIFYLKKKLSFVLKMVNFFIFDESTNFKNRDVMIGIIAHERYAFNCFLRILGIIKMKFGRILRILMNFISNISNATVKTGY